MQKYGPVITAKQAMNLLGISRSCLQKYVEMGYIQYTWKIKNRSFFLRDEILKIAKRLQYKRQARESPIWKENSPVALDIVAPLKDTFPNNRLFYHMEEEEAIRIGHPIPPPQSTYTNITA